MGLCASSEPQQEVRLPPAPQQSDSSNIQPQTAPSHQGAQPAHNEEILQCVHCKHYQDTFDAVSLHETKCAANRAAQLDQLSNVTPTSGQQALSTSATYLIQSMTKKGVRIGTRGRASGVQCTFSAGATTDAPPHSLTSQCTTVCCLWYKCCCCSRIVLATQWLLLRCLLSGCCCAAYSVVVAGAESQCCCCRS